MLVRYLMNGGRDVTFSVGPLSPPTHTLSRRQLTTNLMRDVCARTTLSPTLYSLISLSLSISPFASLLRPIFLLFDKASIYPRSHRCVRQWLRSIRCPCIHPSATLFCWFYPSLFFYVSPNNIITRTLFFCMITFYRYTRCVLVLLPSLTFFWATPVLCECYPPFFDGIPS